MNKKNELSFDILCYKIDNMHLCQSYNSKNVILHKNLGSFHDKPCSKSVYPLEHNLQS